MENFRGKGMKKIWKVKIYFFFRKVLLYFSIDGSLSKIKMKLKDGIKIKVRV